MSPAGHQKRLARQRIAIAVPRDIGRRPPAEHVALELHRVALGVWSHDAVSLRIRLITYTDAFGWN
jgi:hypothetical protein